MTKLVLGMLMLAFAVGFLRPGVALGHGVSEEEYRALKDRMPAIVLFASGLALMTTGAILDQEGAPKGTSTLMIVGGAGMGLGAFSLIRSSIKERKARKKRQEEEKAELGLGLALLSGSGELLPVVGIRAGF